MQSLLSSNIFVWFLSQEQLLQKQTRALSAGDTGYQLEPRSFFPDSILTKLNIMVCSAAELPKSTAHVPKDFSE